MWKISGKNVKKNLLKKWGKIEETKCGENVKNSSGIFLENNVEKKFALKKRG